MILYSSTISQSSDSFTYLFTFCTYFRGILLILYYWKITLEKDTPYKTFFLKEMSEMMSLFSLIEYMFWIFQILTKWYNINGHIHGCSPTLQLAVTVICLGESPCTS